MNIYLIIIFIVSFIVFAIIERLKKNKFFITLQYISVIIMLSIIIFAIIKLIGFFKGDFSLLLSIFALLISLLTLLYAHIFFNNKIEINKKKEIIRDNCTVFLKITNKSNKDIKLINIFIDGEKLFTDYNYENNGKECIRDTIDGITYMMFKYTDEFKVNRGSNFKIQYYREENCKHFKALNVKLEIKYKTLAFEKKKIIETDLSPFV